MTARGVVKSGKVELLAGHGLPEGATVQVQTVTDLGRPELPAQIANQELLLRVKAALLEAHGPRLKGVVLYGSQARGDYRPDSDVDLLVLLEGPIELARDLETNIHALYGLSLELGRPISAKPVDAVEYETISCPLYEAAHEEGIVA